MSNVIKIIILLALIVAIPVSVKLAQDRQIFKGRAQGEEVSVRVPGRANYNELIDVTINHNNNCLLSTSNNACSVVMYDGNGTEIQRQYCGSINGVCFYSGSGGEMNMPGFTTPRSGPPTAVIKVFNSEGQLFVGGEAAIELIGGPTSTPIPTPTPTSSSGSGQGCTEWLAMIPGSIDPVNYCTTAGVAQDCQGPGPYTGDQCCYRRGRDYCQSGQTSQGHTYFDEIRCCYNTSPTSTPTPTPGGGGGGGGGGGSCPYTGDNCIYSATDNQCYSGKTSDTSTCTWIDGKCFNPTAGCTYSCGPVQCPTGGGPGPTATPIPGGVCTPGDFKTQCTGNRGSCASDAGEQEVWQCTAAGQWGSSYGQCSRECVRCADPSLPSQPPTGSCTPGSFTKQCTAKRGSCASDAGEQEVWQCTANGTWGSSYGQCSTECGRCVAGGTTPTSSPTPTGTRTPTPTSTPAGSPTPTSSPTPTTTITPTVTPTIPPNSRTTQYKIAETREGLDSVKYKTYDSQPKIESHTFTNTPGDKFIWARFKSNLGTEVTLGPVKIKLLGADPSFRTLSCQESPTGVGTQVTIKGENFGDQGTSRVTINNQPAEITFWGTIQALQNLEKSSSATPSATPTQSVWYKIIAKINDKFNAGTSIMVKLIPGDGRAAVEGNCIVSTPTVDFGISIPCRPPSSPSTQNVRVQIHGVGEARSIYDSKISFNEDNKPQWTSPKLEIDKNYRLIVKAPKTLAAKKEFIAEDGTTILGNNILLPVGDIFPLESPDGAINALDKAELVREWSTTVNVTRAGDLNQDSRVNSIDYSCMLTGFNKPNEKFLTGQQ